MNNNPYQQPPQQPAQPQQPVQPQYPMPPYPYAPVKPKFKFFDQEMIEILGCTSGALSLGLMIASAIVSGNVTYILGLIMTIVAAVFSVGAFVFNLVLGNKKRMRGEARGALLSWGFVFSLVAIVLFMFLIFFASCMTCYYSKNFNIRW